MKDEHIKNEKLKQQALEEQKKYTRQCYLEHLQGKGNSIVTGSVNEYFILQKCSNKNQKFKKQKN